MVACLAVVGGGRSDRYLSCGWAAVCGLIMSLRFARLRKSDMGWATRSPTPVARAAVVLVLVSCLAVFPVVGVCAYGFVSLVQFALIRMRLLGSDVRWAWFRSSFARAAAVVVLVSCLVVLSVVGLRAWRWFVTLVRCARPFWGPVVVWGPIVALVRMRLCGPDVSWET